MNDDLSSLESFDGVVRLFPLPNLVLFPRVVQPLHIFEPRYREMAADALAGDRLIAMVLLQPGWEANYQAQPAIHSVACLGKIIGDQSLPDGRYNLLLRGVVRLRIEEELVTAKPYRSARVELLIDQEKPEAWSQATLRRKLADFLPDWFANQPKTFATQVEKLVKSALPLGVLCDVLSFALPLDVPFKQQLLEEPEVEERARLLLRYLKKQSAPSGTAATGDRPPFPPAFSDN